MLCSVTVKFSSEAKVDYLSSMRPDIIASQKLLIVI